MDAREPIQVEVEVLPAGEGLDLPRYETDGSAGLDLRAAIHELLVVAPGARVLVPTGLRIAIPRGYEGQVRPRSGLALKLGLTVLNAPGTIDADYRGPLQVILVNLGAEPVTIERGMRIAQIVFAPVTRAEWRLAAALSATTRGEGGFGHTGS